MWGGGEAGDTEVVLQVAKMQGLCLKQEKALQSPGKGDQNKSYT